MEGPRLTEERLRHHLDARQPDREGLCLALLPVLGPYSRERPRRPKGGPDGGRDIEAMHDGKVVVWCAVGFRNGGGNDSQARDEAQAKFRSDLARMLEEEPGLQGFAFFTNVDLTPSQVDDMRAHALAAGPTHVEIFDFERIRNALDSPEGMIPRLQWLGIPMSPTEQAALVSRFGKDLQRVITARLDRVERTISELDHFMAFHKPVFRLDVFVQMKSEMTTVDLGDEILILHVTGLRDLSDPVVVVCRSDPAHPKAAENLVFRPAIWVENSLIGGQGQPSFQPHTVSNHPRQGWAFTLLALLRTGSQYVRLIDLMFLKLEAICTKGMRARIERFALDVNGYELFKCVPDSDQAVTPPIVPTNIGFDPQQREWVRVVELAHRDCFFDPPRPSGRFKFPASIEIERGTARGLPPPSSGLED